jgi:hypothetical protein
MISQNDIAIEFAENSPCIPEYLISCNATPVDSLKAALTRFGLDPHLIGLKTAKDGRVEIIARDLNGTPKTIGRILHGVTIEQLTEARDQLHGEGWKPKIPNIELLLPDGKAA